MKLAIVTAYPPSKVTLTEYGYHLVKHFRIQNEVSEIVLITDKTEKDKDLNFEGEGCKISVKECWNFNSYTNLLSISKTITETKPDAVLFNLQFLKFGDKKIPAALGLLLPLTCKLKGIPTISLLHNIMEQVDLKNAGITKNIILQKGLWPHRNYLDQVCFSVGCTCGYYKQVCRYLRKKIQGKKCGISTPWSL